MSTPRIFRNAALEAVVLTGFLCAGAFAAGGEFVWVERGAALAPIVLAEGAGEETARAAEDLADYVERITGARPEVLAAPDTLPRSAVFVGLPQDAGERFAGVDLDFAQPEEILIACTGNDLLIAGRDVEVAGQQVEFGTANAVSTFIHDRLGVRWLWPGELGTDIPRRDRIAFEPFTFRFHPPIRSRRFRLMPRYTRTRGDDVDAVNYFWENAHRANRRSSHVLPRDHAFNDWSDRYHDEHPEFFALQPDGTRGRGRNVKLCVSNPAVARQWVENQVEVLRENPGLASLSATPNDGGGWCVCEDCRAMDHPDAPPRVHTERYVEFWNRLARGLRERLPGHGVFLDVLAYAAYKAPPIDTRLEDDIAVTYVGHYPLCTEAEWRQTRADMLGWKEAGAKVIGYRPNLHFYDGGFWGMPSVAMEKTHDLFAVLAEIDAHVFEGENFFMFSSTQGPQHYLMARLAYHPAADGRAILRDFYVRGFGPAADDVEAYYEFLEAAHRELVENPAWRVSSAARIEHLDLLRGIYTPARIEQGRAILDRARTRAEGADPVIAERVTFVRAGLEFVALNMEAAAYMERVRRSEGGDREAVERALEISRARDALLAEAPPFFIDVPFFQQRIVSPTSSLARRMGDYLGPPSPRFIDAEPTAAPRELAVVHQWREDFRDDFDREEIGPNWESLSGRWAIRDGLLVASGDRDDNILLLAEPKPGLQRIEFVAASVPPGWEADPEGASHQLCDLTALMHTSADRPLDGYTVQFGARFNSANVVRRNRANVVMDLDAERIRIEPGRFYTLMAEFDGRHVRLAVDGVTILEYEEKQPLLGSEHNRIGIYSYTPMQVRSVRVFTAEAREVEFYDDPDTN